MLRPADVRWSVLPLLALAACEVTPRSVVPAAEAAPAAPARTVAALEPALATKLDELAAALEHQRETLHLPGFALAIVQDDRLVFARGFGLADALRHHQLVLRR